MENILVAIYDKVSNYYQVVRQETNKGTAIRWFQDDICGVDGPVKKNPADYCLVQLGTFNYSTGEIAPQFEKIIDATECCVANLGLEA